MELGEAGYLKQRLTSSTRQCFVSAPFRSLGSIERIYFYTHVSMVLDYGCGGSACRPLFGNCAYHRADLSGGGNLDFEYCPDAKSPPLMNFVNLLPRLAEEGVLVVDDYGAWCQKKQSTSTVHKGDRDPPTRIDGCGRLVIKHSANRSVTR